MGLFRCGWCEKELALLQVDYCSARCEHEASAAKEARREEGLAARQAHREIREVLVEVERLAVEREKWVATRGEAALQDAAELARLERDKQRLETVNQLPMVARLRRLEEIEEKRPLSAEEREEQQTLSAQFRESVAKLQAGWNTMDAAAERLHLQRVSEERQRVQDLQSQISRAQPKGLFANYVSENRFIGYILIAIAVLLAGFVIVAFALLAGGDVHHETEEQKMEAVKILLGLLAAAGLIGLVGVAAVRVRGRWLEFERLRAKLREVPPPPPPPPPPPQTPPAPPPRKP